MSKMGRPPINDDELVKAIIAKVEDGTPLRIALNKVRGGAPARDRVRRKVRTVQENRRKYLLTVG
jgi:hypothetical protein